MNISFFTQKNFSPKPRLLLSAYQCAPEMGSTSHIGWQWYSRLAKRIPVTLITHIRNQSALQKVGAPFPHSEIVFIDTEYFAGPLYRSLSKFFPKSEYAVSLLSFADFYFYDTLAVKQMKKRQQAGEGWDIIHQVTPVSPKSITRLHTLNCPVVLGPWNGGLTLPLAFPKVILQDTNWMYPLRHLGNLVEFFWQSLPHASVILTATQATFSSIPKKFHSRCQHFLENGVDLELFTPAPWPAPPSSSQPLQIVFVGRLVAFKGMPMLLEAIARLKNYRPLQLNIVGRGPREREWKELATRLDLDQIVTWHGAADHAQVVRQLHQAHVLCLPSVRESGGSVLLEAMACARPVLAVDYGGPGEIIDERVGRVVPSQGTATVIKGLMDGLNDIFEHPEVWKKRGEMARQRAETLYSWEAKIDQALVIYRNLLAEPLQRSHSKTLKTHHEIKKMNVV